VDKSFQSEVAKIAIPVALQSMLQSSFSMIDQIMVGQLGEKSIAAVEIAAKPSFIYAFVIGAVGTIAGIMISQYIGKKDIPAEEKSVCVNTLIMLIVGLLFMAISGLFARPFIALFTEDSLVITEGTHYLQLIGLTYIPLGISNICGVAIRCRGRSSWPLYVGALSAGINTLFNYCLIFGNFGMPKLGVRGAAIASVISQLVGALISLLLLFRLYKNMHISIRLGRDGYIQYFAMLLPVVVNEFLWSVGQSINTFVYGHIGTKELAGMSLTGSVQGLTIGAMSGLAQAAGILIGKRLGEKEYDKAYKESIWLCLYGLAGSLILSIMLILLSNRYVKFFNVEKDVRSIGTMLLITFAILIPVKVENMIMGGGILRSGGKTKYIMYIDVIGTWLVGVPLGLITGVVLKMPIVWVYFILSQEEMVRLIISIVLFKKRKWINTLK